MVYNLCTLYCARHIVDNNIFCAKEKKVMRINSAHILLYAVILLASYFAGYWAGNCGYLDNRIRPLFAAFNVPLLYASSPVTSTTLPSAAVLAPTATTMPPVPLQTLAAANELPDTQYAPI